MTRRPTAATARQAGFSLVEVMISIAILTIGLLALAAAFGAALASTQSTQEDLIARQKAMEAMESIFTARQTQQITFAQIRNAASGGIFTDGPTTLQDAGADGLVGTGDDVDFAAHGICPAGPECVVMPGPDGILGTPDDLALPLSNFTRTITITNVLNPDLSVNPNLRQITVTVSYVKPGFRTPSSYTTTALISSFR